MSNSYLQSIKERIFLIKSEEEFDDLALEIFDYQSVHCPIYSQYIDLLGIDRQSIDDIEKIPFLPIEFFKSTKVYSVAEDPQKIFTSSATSGMVPSKHYVADLSIYEESLLKSFTLEYGDPSQYTFLALLPSYLEREGSSLIYMVDRLMGLSGKSANGFYLYNHSELFETLGKLRDKDEKSILFGVSFALLDFANEFTCYFPSLIIIETGGMKGRGRELPREIIHQRLQNSFGVEKVHSEYGMAELLSQAYSHGNGLFNTPPWMKILIRDFNNPFKLVQPEEVGGINVIDLANIGSCSFIETQDMGIKTAEDLFKITGRIKNSEIRGCNLLLA
ncbi:MAG TPA: acyltransferase [Bacteroidales bacterium]|nr:acyltransferase [Bacteroidales bacterium]